MALASVDSTRPTEQSKNTAKPAATNGVSNGLQLAIGSLGTAQDGKYQAVISSLSETSGGKAVDKQMLDRLVDGGMTLALWLSYVFILAQRPG